MTLRAWSVAVVLFSLLFARHGHTQSAPMRVAVIPFATEHDLRELDATGITLAEGAYGALAMAPEIAAVDRLHLLDVLRDQEDHRSPQGKEALPDEGALAAGRMLGATHLLMGNYLSAGGVTRATLRLVSVQTRQVTPIGQAHAAAQDPLGLRDEVYCLTLRHLRQGSGDQTCRIDERALTQSAAAQKSYADSLLLVYRRRLSEAVLALNKALSLDPRFTAARSLREALYFLVVPGNEWVYQILPRAQQADPITYVRRVTEADQDPEGNHRYTVKYRIGAVVKPEWGECQMDGEERLVARGGWMYLLEMNLVSNCAKLSRPHRLSMHFGAGLPHLPLASDQAMVGEEAHPLEMTVTIAGVGRVISRLHCTRGATALPSVATPLGKQAGVQVRNQCSLNGAPTVERYNEDRANNYARRHQERLMRMEQRNQNGGLFDNIVEASKVAATDETVQPEELRVEDYQHLNIQNFDYRRTFVPGIGVVHTEESMRCGGSQAGELAAQSRLTGLQLYRLSAASPMRDQPLLLGELSRHEPTRFGGRPTRFGFGVLIGFLRPRYEYWDLRFEDAALRTHILGDVFGISASHWLAGVFRVSLDAGVYAQAAGENFDTESLRRTYGKDYKAAEWLHADAGLRARIAGRGVWSIPQIAIGTRLSVWTIKNGPPDSKDGPAPIADFGLYGRLLDQTYVLYQPYAGFLAHFSFHDRVVLELGYLFSWWRGAFAFDDQARNIDFFSHGPRAMFCLGTSADRGKTGFAGCAEGFADLSLLPSAQGASQGVLRAAGAMIQLVLTRGSLVAEKQ